jgi:hypothetical protein
VSSGFSEASGRAIFDRLAGSVRIEVDDASGAPALNKRIEKIDQAVEKMVQGRADMITGELETM